MFIFYFNYYFEFCCQFLLPCLHHKKESFYVSCYSKTQAWCFYLFKYKQKFVPAIALHPSFFIVCHKVALSDYVIYFDLSILDLYWSFSGLILILQCTNVIRAGFTNLVLIGPRISTRLPPPISWIKKVISQKLFLSKQYTI